MNWLRRLFGRQRTLTYVSLGGEPTPVPLCPVHGRDCGKVPSPFVGPGWLQERRPCPAWWSAIERAELSQTHEAFWNPTTETFDIFPR